MLLLLNLSCVKTFRGLSGELHFFDANNHVIVEGVIDVGKIFEGRAASHSSELIVHRTVANAHPSLHFSKLFTL
jgi:hypothetical protein